MRRTQKRYVLNPRILSTQTWNFSGCFIWLFQTSKRNFCILVSNDNFYLTRICQIIGLLRALRWFIKFNNLHKQMGYVCVFVLVLHVTVYCIVVWTNTIQIKTNLKTWIMCNSLSMLDCVCYPTSPFIDCNAFNSSAI